MGTAMKVYRHMLKNNPVIIQSLQAGFLMGTGDVIAQTIVERKSLKNINLTRTGQFFSIGCLLVGPSLTTWYRTLSKLFGDVGKQTVLKKVALDQLTFAPTFIAVFLTTLGFVQGKNWHGISKEIKENYGDILLNNYKLWPAVQLANFYVVPLNYQVLVVQTVALGWNTYLSVKTQSMEVIETTSNTELIDNLKK